MSAQPYEPGEDPGEDLFEFAARARVTDPVTSAEAAASLEPEALGALSTLVVAELRAAGEGGLTFSELADRLDMRENRDTITPRMSGLVARGLAMDSGERRPGPSGRGQTVWTIGDGRPRLGHARRRNRAVFDEADDVALLAAIGRAPADEAAALRTLRRKITGNG